MTALVQLDVADVGQAEAALAEAVARFGRIDVLVNNAGNSCLGNFEELSKADIDALVNTSVTDAMVADAATKKPDLDKKLIRMGIGDVTQPLAPAVIDALQKGVAEMAHKDTFKGYGPEQGYHLSKDLADHAISMIRNQQATSPSKPWFMFYNPGANHAPHHAPQEYIAKYKGKFDDGYEAYRTWVLARMIEKGVLPKGTKLTPINPLPESMANKADAVRPWNTLNADEKKLFSHMAEVWAGFSEYTDVQIGRVIDYLEKSGQLENTVVLYAADNGTSGEGTPNGSVNENNFFNGYPDDLAENMKLIDKLGSPDTYNHFPTGWAVAFSTPYQDRKSVV